MGKYIINLCDTTDRIICVGVEDGDSYASGVSVSCLTPYTEPDLDAIRNEEYEKGVQDTKRQWADAPRSCAYKLGYGSGLKDAWEAARKICTNWVLSDSVLSEIFGMDKTIDDIMKENTASECIEKIRQYEQEKEEQKQIQVGDEVNWMGDKYVVTYVRCEAKKADLISCKFGSACENVAFSALVKTGRHFPKIAEVLAKMREESNG